MTSQEIGAWFLYWLRDLATFLALGLLVIWLIPRPFNRWSEIARRSPFKSFGAGIVVIIVGYVGFAIVFALVLALGIFLYVIKFGDLGGAVLGFGLPATAVAFGALNVFVAFISKLVVAFLFGKILFERWYPKALAHNIWPLLLGLIVYLLIRAIPWLGWAVGSVVTLVGLGAIWIGLSRLKAPVEAPSDVAAGKSPAAESGNLEPLPDDPLATEVTTDQPTLPIEMSEMVEPDTVIAVESLATGEPASVVDESMDNDPQSGD